MSKRAAKITPVEPPATTLDRLVQQRMEETGEEDYTRALMQVVANPDNLELVIECQRWGRRLAGHK